MRARVALAALALAGGIAAPASGARQVLVREIRVERPGTVRVELASDEILRLGDAGAVGVVGPDGEHAAAERRPARAEAPCRPVEIAAVERAADGFRLRLTVPANGGLHGALDFELDRATLAPGCRLEERVADGAWRPLATGDLFRVGEGSELARTRLEYAATGARELRLSWPASAGYPRVRSASVCAPEQARPPQLVPARVTALDSPPGRRVFALELPGRAARLAALELALPAAPAGEPGWRLAFGQDGRWRELASGSWAPGRARHRIDLGDAAFAGRALRVELLGPASGPLTASWDLAPQVVRFAAGRPGIWQLRLPAAAAAATGAVPDPGERAALFAPGATRVEAASWPTPGAGAVLSGSAGGERWAVEAGDAEPGAPLALELPAELLAAPGRGAADARLVAGGRLVPARLEPLAEPRTVALRAELVPRQLERGRSALELDLGRAAGREELTGVVLAAGAAARPFRRELDLVGLGGGPGPAREVRLGSRLWECSAAPGDACELFLDAPGRDFDRLRVELDDGDSAPLSGLSAELLARRWQLVFQRPAGAVELALEARQPAPRFDLAQLDAVLALARPAPARLGSRVATPEAGLGRWAGALLTAAIVAVALALLLLLRRLLPPPRSAG